MQKRKQSHRHILYVQRRNTPICTHTHAQTPCPHFNSLVKIIKKNKNVMNFKSSNWCVCVCAGVRWQSSDMSSSAASEGARLRVSGIPLQGKY